MSYFREVIFSFDNHAGVEDRGVFCWGCRDISVLPNVHTAEFFWHL